VEEYSRSWSLPARDIEAEKVVWVGVIELVAENMSLVAACAWLRGEGYEVAVEPDVADRSGSWSYSGSAQGVRAMLERVYAVSSIAIDGVVWFGGERRLQRYEFGLGGGDPGGIVGAVEKLVGENGHVLNIGGRIVVLATPVVIDTVKAIDWYARQDYQVTVSVFEVMKASELGLSGKAGLSVSDQGSSLLYDFNLSADQQVAQLVREWQVTAVPGVEASLSIGEERLIPQYTVEDDSRLVSGTEAHKAGMQLAFSVGQVGAGAVSVRYHLEASAFTDDEGVGRQVSKMAGALRCLMNKRYMVGRYRGDIARQWLGLSGIGKRSDVRSVVVTIGISDQQAKDTHDGAKRSCAIGEKPPAASGGESGRRPD